MYPAFYTLISQLTFAIWFFVIHSISILPLNDIDKFPNAQPWKRKLFISWLIIIFLIIGYTFGNVYAKLLLILILSLLMFGHITTWWLPYLFGWPKVFIDKVKIDHKTTFRFLPAYENRPVPGLAYCILGLTGLIALALSIINLN